MSPVVARGSAESTVLLLAPEAGGPAASLLTSELGGLAAALLAATGVYLVHTAIASGRRGLGPAPRLPGWIRRRRATVAEYLAQSGLEGVRPVEVSAVGVTLFACGAVLGYGIYGGWPSALVVGSAGAALPVAGLRSRRRTRRELAREAWPGMLEELRLGVLTLGRPIPQALLEVGLRGPGELRAAFRAAEREWLVSADVERMLGVLKQRLADPTADAVCETLLIAHEVGGTNLDGRLRSLIDDRVVDLRARKEARSRQAGVRFARWFVVLVPLGMALVGLGLGDGRAAFRSVGGQLLVLVAFGVMGVCWGWAARLLRLPDEQRVFGDPAS